MKKEKVQQAVIGKTKKDNQTKPNQRKGKVQIGQCFPLTQKLKIK